MDARPAYASGVYSVAGGLRLSLVNAIMNHLVARCEVRPVLLAKAQAGFSSAYRAVDGGISRNAIIRLELFFKLPIFLCLLGAGNCYSQTDSDLVLKLEKRDLGVVAVCANHAKGEIPAAALSGADQPSTIIAPPLRSSRQEMLDRAKYWENNGHSDFAVKIREQLKRAEQKNAVAEAGNDTLTCNNTLAITEHSDATERITLKSSISLQSQSDTPENTPGSVGGVKQSKQAFLDRAKYWESHGRSDLVEKIRSQLVLAEPKAAAAAAVGNSAVAVTAPSSSTERAMVKSSVNLQNQSETPENTSASVGGVKQSKQALLDRAKYWESRGRSDLVEKIHNQLALVEPKDAAVAAGKRAAVGNSAVAIAAPSSSTERAMVKSPINLQNQSETPENTPASAGGVRQSKQALLDRAKYWESRGRSDLVEKIHNQLALAEPKDAAVAAGKHAAAGNSAVAVTAHSGLAEQDFIAFKNFPHASENAPALSGNLKPSSQELDDRAHYWEAHGRNDLANQIRQKIQALTTPSVATAPLRKSGEMVQAQPLCPEKIQDNQNDVNSAKKGEQLKNREYLDTRLDRAQIYRSAGELAKARVQIESVLSVSPDLPEALYASAQLYAEQRLWMETLHTLDRVSPVSRTPDMISLQKTAWAHVQIDRADALVRQGRNSEAEILLRQVALELSINLNQAPLAEPPPLWKNMTPGRRNDSH